ncbi:hypothetical protein STENM223S_03377 [Streptomyces tendae]
MNDQLARSFEECWDGWRGVRIGSPVVVNWHWCKCRGTTLALCVWLNFVQVT